MDTSIPATSAYYLTSTVPTSNPTYPSVTIYPHVSSAGYYDIYVVIPGCSGIGDCGGRTSVDVEVFPVQGGLGWTSSITEQVQDDTNTLVYSGPVDASSQSFSPTVSIALARSPLPAASGEDYIVVVEAVEMVLTDVTGGVSSSNSSRTSGSAGVNGTTITSSTQINGNSTQVAFGVFEWARSSTSPVYAASSILSSSSETAFSQVGFALDLPYNASSLPSTWSVYSIAVYGSTAFVAGNFTASGNYSNVISVDIASGQASSLSSQGLNGVVHSAAVVGNYVYFGGEFTSTAESGGITLNYLARYDPKGNAWAALGDGADGIVSGLIPSNNSSSQLNVLGNFSHVLASNGTTTQTGGYAIWDSSNSAWSNPAAVFGNVSAAAVTSSSSAVNSDVFLAGKISGVTSNPATGVAMFSTGSDDTATITSLQNVNLDSTGSARPPSASSASRRSRHARRGLSARGWLSLFTSTLARRTIGRSQARASTAPAIASQPATAPAVLAGDFWTNSSASAKTIFTILGGNFTSGSGSGEVEGVAFYSSGKLTGPDPPVQGVVRVVQVMGNDLYVSGTGVNVTGVGSGIVVYHLDSASWMTGNMPSLNPASGATLTVNEIKPRLNTDTVVVAGNFASAGSLSCAAVCLWDTTSSQWSTPGAGLASGEVRAVDFADDSYDVVIVAGSFVMSDGTVAYAASYRFANSTWTALGTLPGPALAIAADNRNASNVFAAGYSTSDASSYLQQWDGQRWTAQNQSLLSGSTVQQLAFVPLSTQHIAAGSIEKDRMLMVSGELQLESSGNVSSALYDGAQWYPYLVASSSTGSAGTVSQLFWSSLSFSFHVRHYLARGIVVLVAIAIATGLILLCTLIAFLFAYLTRRSEWRDPNQIKTFKRENSELSSTHQHVFNNVQAALEQSLAGGSTPAAVAAGRASYPSYYGTAEGTMGSDDEDEEGRDSTMRYDFEGPELQSGELSMRAGQRVIILDDVQSDEWWFARDPATGREGVIPATYGGSRHFSLEDPADISIVW